MNLILFEPAEVGTPLPLADPRAVHLREVLRRGAGDRFDAGLVDGPRGKGIIEAVGPEGIAFRFEPVADPPLPDAVDLLLALSRPQTARKILGEATALGVASMSFFPAEKGEPGYATSTLWKTSEWRRHLLDGAAQAFDTRIPSVHQEPDLAAALAGLPAAGVRVALDNYEATRRLTPDGLGRPLVLAFGPERGWSTAERLLLRKAGFTLAHLGERVLRTETAVVAALAIAKAGT